MRQNVDKLEAYLAALIPGNNKYGSTFNNHYFFINL